jgi:hypothetical protein
VKNVADNEAAAIGVPRKHTSASTKHWTTVWKRQGQSEREQIRDGLARAQYRKRGVMKLPKPSKLEDIRDWSLEEMLEHLRQLCNICIITGMPLERIALHCDRIWRGRYNANDTVSMMGSFKHGKRGSSVFCFQGFF